ncbi:hypothetical protein BC835DRAFT_1418475 [Cytidiella melzeri]|nr:hypothetical protein BC835DRAFT_1418475 [Cytidiella melzeri]
MPDVFFRNETDKPVHVGVWAVWLHCYTNMLAPGEEWKIHLAGIPYTIEIRAGDTDNHFSPNTSNEALAKIGTAWGHGTASVLTAVGWGLGVIGLGGVAGQMASGATRDRAFQTVNDTMGAAIQGGASYFNDRAPGHLLTVPQLSMFELGHRQYAIRRNGEKVQLWDTLGNCVKGEQ